MSSIRFHPFFLRCCVACLVVPLACTRANSSTPQPPPGATGGDWPPSADRIVVLDGLAEDIIPLERRAIYTVPTNRWLVVTDFEAVVDGAEGTALGEVFLGDLRIKRDAVFLGNLVEPERHAFHSSVGIAFRPGSVVVLAHVIAVTNINDDVRYNLVGYLADA